MRRRGPRRGFKHWTRLEDERLRQLVLSQLGRLGTLQAVAEMGHAQFNRDAGSVLRRIRHLRRADAAFDAAVQARLRRTRAAAATAGIGAVDEAGMGEGVDNAARAAREGAAGAAAAWNSAAGTAAAAPAAPAFRLRPAAVSADPGQELLVAFLETHGGPLDARQRERLAALGERYGTVPVMAALAESLLHRADVILEDVERRLAR
ncbi:MAG: hypothetical protein IMW98_10570 [Firmicutes bacterium]|nr:hypothetical protein [Bacillota bacterium]